MKLPLRRFTPQGIEVVGQQLDMIRAGYSVNLEDLLENNDLTEKITSHSVIERKQFANRMECGRYIYELLEAHSAQLPEPESDKGLWTWLAILFHLQLFKSGRDKVGQIDRWIPSTDFRRYYRHLLAGPYFVYKAHEDNPDRAFAVLCTAVSAPGEIVESIVSSKDLIRFPSIMEAVTKLYYDPITGGHKRGASSKKNGGARRFTAVLGQFDLTFDFYGMTSDQILELLPSEFGRFRSS